MSITPEGALTRALGVAFPGCRVARITGAHGYDLFAILLADGAYFESAVPSQALRQAFAHEKLVGKGRVGTFDDSNAFLSQVDRNWRRNDPR